jgi:hypothetical protein
MALTNQQIVDLVNQEFENAQGAPDGDIALERARAYDYYQRKPFGNEEDGASKVVSSDVSDVVDGIMPSLLRIFTSQDNLVSFDPVGPEDEEAAEQESSYISHVFFKKNPAFEILFYWLFDALVQKNGYVKAWWDESEEVTTEEYEGLSELELIALLQDDELEAIEKEERTAETVDALTGQVTDAVVYDVKFRRVVTDGRAVVESVPPEEFRISGDARNLDPSRARFVGHEREVTRDELLAMGFKKKLVMELPASEESLNSTEKITRRDKSDDQRDASARGSTDKSQDLLVLREAYIRVDADEDGRSELKQVFSVDGRELEISDVDRQPFHAISPQPLPHKHFGMGTSEKVMDLQVITSTLTRQVLDNLYHTNNPGHGVWEQGMGENTMDDLLTQRVGKVTRFKRPVQESYTPMTVPFTAGDSFPMIEYYDKVKRDRTGISSDAEGLTPDALKNIQTSVLSQAVDLSKMKIEQIARIFAETGFKTLFRHLHELTQKHQQKSEYVKLRGTWIQVDPRNWRTRKDMTVNIGLGIGTREQNLLHLETIWQKQAAMVEAGGMNLTVTPKNIYNTAVEIVKNANYKLPQMFFTDPGNQPAPPPNDEQAELQRKEQELQARQQQLDAERQQIKQAELMLKNQMQEAMHQRELLKIAEKREERLDKFELENEKLRNALAEMGIKLDIAQTDAVIKQMNAQAQAEQAMAQADQARANADKARAEAAALLLETEKTDLAEESRKQAESDAKVQHTRMQTQKVLADTEKAQAEIDKIRADTRAVQAEVSATEALLEAGEYAEDDDGRESEESE